MILSFVSCTKRWDCRLDCTAEFPPLLIGERFWRGTANFLENSLHSLPFILASDEEFKIPLPLELFHNSDTLRMPRPHSPRGTQLLYVLVDTADCAGDFAPKSPAQGGKGVFYAVKNSFSLTISTMFLVVSQSSTKKYTFSEVASSPNSSIHLSTSS